LTCPNKVSPLGIGLLAQATSLRVALGLLILTSLGIAGLATRWPVANIDPNTTGHDQS
jgi:hypothetical protein